MRLKFEVSEKSGLSESLVFKVAAVVFNVARFGNFRKVLATNLLTKVVQKDC